MTNELKELIRKSVNLHNNLNIRYRVDNHATKEFRKLLLRNGVSFVTIDEKEMIKVVMPEDVYVEPVENEKN